jgi:hypothetical protein
MKCINCEENLLFQGQKFCSSCGWKIEKKDKEIVTMYLHRDKESNYDIGEEIGLSEEALKKFAYALSEVEFNVEVDMKTGNSKIIDVDGRKLL